MTIRRMGAAKPNEAKLTEISNSQVLILQKKSIGKVLLIKPPLINCIGHKVSRTTHLLMTIFKVQQFQYGDKSFFENLFKQRNLEQGFAIDTCWPDGLLRSMRVSTFFGVLM